MSGNNTAPKDEWVRLNVGGKVFQSTKDTLSRYPDIFLDRLVNGGLSSEKDESGAYLIDADPEHFRTILNYLRRGSVTLDASKVILGDLLREADFFNIEPLVIEIHHAMSAPDPMTAMTNRIIAKMNDMSKKRPSISPMPMMTKMARMGDMCQPIIHKQPMLSKPQPMSHDARAPSLPIYNYDWDPTLRKMSLQ